MNSNIEKCLKEDLAVLRGIYEKWQYSICKTPKIDKFVDCLCEALSEGEMIVSSPESYCEEE